MTHARFLVLLAALLTLVGCGGKGGESGNRPASRVGSAKISIVWPAQSRVIPLTANSVLVTLSSPSRGYEKKILLKRSDSGPTLVSEATFGYLGVADDYSVQASAYAEAEEGDLEKALPLARGTAPGLRIDAGKTTLFAITMDSELKAVRVSGLVDGAFLIDEKGSFRIGPSGVRAEFQPKYNLAQTSKTVALTPLGKVGEAYSDLNLFVYGGTTRLSTVDLQLTKGLVAIPKVPLKDTAEFEVRLIDLSLTDSELNVVYSEDGEVVKTYKATVDTSSPEIDVDFAVLGVPSYISGNPTSFDVRATLTENAFNGVAGLSQTVSYEPAGNRIKFVKVKNRGQDFKLTLDFRVKVAQNPLKYVTLVSVVDNPVANASLFGSNAPQINVSEQGKLADFILKDTAFSLKRGDTTLFIPTYLAFFGQQEYTLPPELFTLSVSGGNDASLPSVSDGYKLKAPASTTKVTTVKDVVVTASLLGTSNLSRSVKLTITLPANAGNVTGGVR